MSDECHRCGKHLAFPLNSYLSVSFAEGPFDGLPSLSDFGEVHICDECAEAYYQFINGDYNE